MNDPNLKSTEQETNDSSNDAEFIEQIKTALTDALVVLKYLIVNLPDLPKFFFKHEKQRIIRLSIALGCFSLFAFIIATKGIMDSFYNLGLETSQYSLIPIIAFITLGLSSFITRKLFKAEGSLEGDLFISGTSLLPTGIFILLASFLGLKNIEIIAFLLVFNLTYTILSLHVGITEISKVKEKYSSISIAVMLILTMWLSKIIISSLF